MNRPPGPGWFPSNHDHSPWRHAGPAATPRSTKPHSFLLLTLLGVAILYQGDEIGLLDGKVPKDRIRDIATPSRDPKRTPMPWTPSGAEWNNPWLPLTDTTRNVETSPEDFTDGSYETLDAPKGVWVYRRGDKICRLNMTAKKIDDLDPWEGVIE